MGKDSNTIASIQHLFKTVPKQVAQHLKAHSTSCGWDQDLIKLATKTGNKSRSPFVQFHQNQPNSRVACMILLLYVATPWTYRHLLSCGGNEWFDVFMNILCSSHWNQAEHPCLHKYKKVISIKQIVLWIDSFNRHIHGPCRAHF